MLADWFGRGGSPKRGENDEIRVSPRDAAPRVFYKLKSHYIYNFNAAILL